MFSVWIKVVGPHHFPAKNCRNCIGLLEFGDTKIRISPNDCSQHTLEECWSILMECFVIYPPQYWCGKLLWKTSFSFSR